MTQPWNMSRVRSRQLPRKYKPAGPVGCKLLSEAERECVPMAALVFDTHCNTCGYHVCSCDWVKPEGTTKCGIPIVYYPYAKKGEAYAWRGGDHPLKFFCGMLTRKQLTSLQAFDVRRPQPPTFSFPLMVGP